MLRFNSCVRPSDLLGNIRTIKLVILALLVSVVCNSQVIAQNDLADVIEQCEKSLVRIEVTGADGGGLGSGFVVSNDGLVVTNVHVMAGAQKATVIFPDGRKHEIVGTHYIDEGRDVCVARIKMTGAVPIKLAGSLPRKGETVTALGSPLGLSFTATNGIISAIRSGEELGREIGDTTMKGTWVQVDAALSPGNSGGPLINRKGEVVAMSTRASQGVAQNLNFGISIVDIRAAIVKAKVSNQIAFAEGVGKIGEHSSSGGSAGRPPAAISKKEVPQSALDNYIQEGKDSFRQLASRVRRDATASEKEWREMRKGEPFIPGQYDNGSAVVRVSGRSRSAFKYFFRGESIKRRIVAQREERKDKLKDLKKQLEDSDGQEALFALLQNAGPLLDPQESKSVGFMYGATVVHAFNDHEIIVSYEGSPYLMWVESTSGLSGGQELSPAPVFVAGTKTVLIPGMNTMSVTVLQSVTDRELEKAVMGGLEYLTWTDKTGKYKIEAALIKNDGTKVHLKKRDGSTVEIELSKLDQKSQDAAKQ